MLDDDGYVRLLDLLAQVDESPLLYQYVCDEIDNAALQNPGELEEPFASLV
jgi:hypothetical protein